jgi:hypothetical protein
MNRTTALLAVTSLLLGYYLWSFFVGSRYQALCNVDYWSATKEQRAACRDMQTELEPQR